MTLLTVFCSHFRAYELYTDTVYNELSLIGTECSSWIDYIFNKCSNNIKVPMGHATSSK